MHRLLLTTLRRLQEPGPRGLRSSLEQDDIAVTPSPSAPVGVCRPPLLGFVTRFRREPVLGWCPFIDLIPGVRLPAFGLPFGRLGFGREQQAPIAFRPRRFARPRRFSPPIARVSPSSSTPFRMPKDLRACCISLPIVGFDAFLPPRPVEPAPTLDSLLNQVLLVTRTAVSRIEVRTPRRIPPTCSSVRCRTFGARRRAPCSPRTLRRLRSAASLRLRFQIRGSVVSEGRRPSRLCSVGRCVPSHAVFGRTLAYPPWALVPFEVAFMSFLAV
jgi:hypothetical protein